MIPTESTSQPTPHFPASETDSITQQHASINEKRASDSIYSGKCMQLIWNEVGRLTLLGVIRTEEDKWFFAYRKAVRILSGDD